MRFESVADAVPADLAALPVDSAPPARSAEEAPRHLAVAAEALPPPIPDTFPQDLLQTEKALQAVEPENARLRQSDNSIAPSDDTQWTADLVKLREALSRMDSLSKPPEPSANPGVTPSPQF
jgi:hypothetical protein